MNAKKKSASSSQGVSMNNLSQVSPDEAVPEEARAEANPDQKLATRISISALDPEVLAELRGFTLWLSMVGGRDGLRTIGDVVTAALNGDGSLPYWRDRYHNGEKFPLAASVPPGRK